MDARRTTYLTCVLPFNLCGMKPNEKENSMSLCPSAPDLSFISAGSCGTRDYRSVVPVEAQGHVTRPEIDGYGRRCDAGAPPGHRAASGEAFSALGCRVHVTEEGICRLLWNMASGIPSPRDGSQGGGTRPLFTCRPNFAPQAYKSWTRPWPSKRSAWAGPVDVESRAC